jgi:ribosomal protein L37E
MLGKLQQTLKERCDDCGTRLEIRRISQVYLREGEDIDFHVDKKYCSKCDIFIDDEEDKEKKPWKRFKEVEVPSKPVRPTKSTKR